MLYRTFQTAGQFFQQCNAAFFIIAEYNHFLKLIQPIPAIWYPRKTFCTGWNRNSIVNPCFCYGKTINLSFCNNQLVKFVIALRHSKQNWFAVRFTPFFILVFFLVKISLAIFHKLHFPFFVIERKYKNIGVFRLYGYLIFFSNLFGYSA